MNDYEATKRAATNDAHKRTLPSWGEGGCLTAPGTLSPPRDVAADRDEAYRETRALLGLLRRIVSGDPESPSPETMIRGDLISEIIAELGKYPK